MLNVHRNAIVMLILALSSFHQRASGRTAEEAEKVAQRVLERAILIDLHSDTTQMMLDEGYDLADPGSPFMVSIPKMRQGRLGAAFFSVWVAVDWPKGSIVQRAMDEIDVIHEQVARHSDTLGLASTADDIIRLHGRNNIRHRVYNSFVKFNYSMPYSFKRIMIIFFIFFYMLRNLL